jgi:hypothetical protein
MLSISPGIATFSLAAVFCSNQLVDSPWLASWPMLRGIQLRNAASLDGALAWRRQAQLHGKVRDFLSERRRHHFPSGLFGTWSFIWLSDTGCTHVAEVRGIKNTLKRRYLNSNEFGLGEHFYITFLSLTALSLARGHFPITQGIIDFLRDLTDATATSCQGTSASVLASAVFFTNPSNRPVKQIIMPKKFMSLTTGCDEDHHFWKSSHAHENVPKKGNIACMPLSKRTKTTP